MEVVHVCVLMYYSLSLQSRELKSVNLDCAGHLIKLVLQPNHINRLNLFNQVHYTIVTLTSLGHALTYIMYNIIVMHDYMLTILFRTVTTCTCIVHVAVCKLYSLVSACCYRTVQLVVIELYKLSRTYRY